jgi:hypothetical protein
MAHNNDSVKVRMAPVLLELAVETVQLRAQQHRGVPNGQAGGIEENPKLVARPNPRVAHKAVEHLHPRLGPGEQAMNENHRNPFAIVELKLIKPGMPQMLSSKNQARDVERTIRRAGERERDRRGKISR